MNLAAELIDTTRARLEKAGAFTLFTLRLIVVTPATLRRFGLVAARCRW